MYWVNDHFSSDFFYGKSKILVHVGVLKAINIKSV